MKTKVGAFGLKAVTTEQVKLGRLELPKVSENIRKIIVEAKLKSLEGVLGPNSDTVVRQLVRDYWETQ